MRVSSLNNGWISQAVIVCLTHSLAIVWLGYFSNIFWSYISKYVYTLLSFNRCFHNALKLLLCLKDTDPEDKGTYHYIWWWTICHRDHLADWSWRGKKRERGPGLQLWPAWSPALLPSRTSPSLGREAWGGCRWRPPPRWWLFLFPSWHLEHMGITLAKHKYNI